MRSAFGVDHGQVSKGIGDVVRVARNQGKAAKAGFKLARAHNKSALMQAGYPTKAGANFKESVKAGMRGKPAANAYKAGRKSALQAGRARTVADIGAISQGRKPGGLIDPGMAHQASAGFNRGMSRHDWRLK